MSKTPGPPSEALGRAAQGLNASPRPVSHATSAGGSSSWVTVPKSDWVPDDEVSACTQCSRPFTLFFRRHHCRACGKIFCDGCSSLRLAGQRACRACVQARMQSTIQASLKESGSAAATDKNISSPYPFRSSQPAVTPQPVAKDDACGSFVENAFGLATLDLGALSSLFHNATETIPEGPDDSDCENEEKRIMTNTDTPGMTVNKKIPEVIECIGEEDGVREKDGEEKKDSSENATSSASPLDTTPSHSRTTTSTDNKGISTSSMATPTSTSMNNSSRSNSSNFANNCRGNSNHIIRSVSSIIKTGRVGDTQTASLDFDTLLLRACIALQNSAYYQRDRQGSAILPTTTNNSAQSGQSSSSATNESKSSNSHGYTEYNGPQGMNAVRVLMEGIKKQMGIINMSDGRLVRSTSAIGWPRAPTSTFNKGGNRGAHQNNISGNNTSSNHHNSGEGDNIELSMNIDDDKDDSSSSYKAEITRDDSFIKTTPNLTRRFSKFLLKKGDTYSTNSNNNSNASSSSDESDKLVYPSTKPRHRRAGSGGSSNSKGSGGSNSTRSSNNSGGSRGRSKNNRNTERNSHASKGKRGTPNTNSNNNNNNNNEHDLININHSVMSVDNTIASPTSLYLLSLNDALSQALRNPKVSANIHAEAAFKKSGVLQTIDAILASFESLRYQGPNGIDKYFPTGRFALYRSLLKIVLTNSPLVFVLPAYPCKSPNTTKKVLSHLPDAGEYLSLVRINSFCREVSTIYSPGCYCVIFSDGRVFADLVGVKHEYVDEYWKELKNIMNNSDNNNSNNNSSTDDNTQVHFDNAMENSSHVSNSSNIGNNGNTDNSEYLRWDSLDDRLLSLFQTNNYIVTPLPVSPSSLPPSSSASQSPSSRYSLSPSHTPSPSSSPSSDIPFGFSSFQHLHHNTERFLKDVWEPKEALDRLDKDISAGGDVAVLYRGFMKFLEQDRLWDTSMSKSAIKKHCGVVAKRMIVRNQSFSQFVSSCYPDAIRLSIHAHNNAGPKYAVRLLTDVPYCATPWHNVVVRLLDGTDIIMKKEDAEKLKTKLILHPKWQRPWMYQQLPEEVAQVPLGMPRVASSVTASSSGKDIVGFTNTHPDGENMMSGSKGSDAEVVGQATGKPEHKSKKGKKEVSLPYSIGETSLPTIDSLRSGT